MVVFQFHTTLRHIVVRGEMIQQLAQYLAQLRCRASKRSALFVAEIEEHLLIRERGRWNELI